MSAWVRACVSNPHSDPALRKMKLVVPNRKRRQWILEQLYLEQNHKLKDFIFRQHCCKLGKKHWKITPAYNLFCADTYFYVSAAQLFLCRYLHLWVSYTTCFVQILTFVGQLHNLFCADTYICGSATQLVLCRY